MTDHVRLSEQQEQRTETHGSCCDYGCFQATTVVLICIRDEK